MIIFLFFYLTILIFFKILKKDRNFRKFGYVFVSRFDIALKYFSVSELNDFVIIYVHFFRQWNFRKCKKKKFECFKKKYSIHLMQIRNISSVHLLNTFSLQFVNNFSALLLWKINIQIGLFNKFDFLLFLSY